MWGGPISYDISTKDEHIQAFVHLTNNEDYDEHATVIHAYAFVPQYQNWMISNGYAYTKPEAGPLALREFRSIPQIRSGARITSMMELANEMTESNPRGKRYLQCHLGQCSAC